MTRSWCVGMLAAQRQQAGNGMSEYEHPPQQDLPPPRWSLLPMPADPDELRAALARTRHELAATEAALDDASMRLRMALGMAAHDLRNPAGSIRGFAQTLLLRTGDRLDPRERELLTRIVDASDRMLRIVHELLELAEVDDRGAELELEDCDLRAVVDDALAAARVAADDKEIELRLAAPTSVPAHADPERLAQVLLNLLSNAVHYSHRSSRVEVTLEADDENARIAVTDHGVGIPQDEIGDLFAPFTRASTRPTEGEESTGLGLTIADRIVRAHGGRLAVTSTVGEGSVFTVQLPRTALAAAPDEEPVRASVSRRSDSRAPSSR